MKPCIVLSLLTTLCAGAPFAQTKTGTEGKQSESGSQESTADSKVGAEQKRVTAERMKVMQKLSSDVKGTISIAGKEVPLRKHANPILRFNDPSRSFQDGALWLWGEETGRPHGLIAVERYKRGWGYECISMTTSRTEAIEATVLGNTKWKPQKPGLAFQQIADHDPPGETDFRRLQQFKAIARRFRFRETYLEQDSELRLVSSPIHRYSEPGKDIVDAAMFVFANGTNPEVLLILECQKMEEGHRWVFTVARLSLAQLQGWMDKKSVFQSAQQKVMQVSEPYLSAYFHEGK